LLDEIKVSEGKFFATVNRTESNKGSHSDIYVLTGQAGQLLFKLLQGRFKVGQRRGDFSQ